MHIGVVAQRTDLSLRTLRHYDEIGLLTPSGRSEGGFRQYAEEDVERLLVIRRMKPLDFTLEEMSAAMSVLEVLRGDERDPAVLAEAQASLAALQAEARSRRTRLERHLAMADEFIDLLDRQRPGQPG